MPSLQRVAHRRRGNRGNINGGGRKQLCGGQQRNEDQNHKVIEQRCSQISSAIGGYQRDDYVIVGDQLVIVDHSARRVVAIVPNIG